MRRRIELIFFLALLGAPLAADEGFSSVPGVKLQDEGSTLGQVTTINAVGAGVTATRSGTVGTLTISGGGGGGGSANVVEVTLDFGSTGNDTASTVVTGQSWVTVSSVIACSPTLLATTDRLAGAEDPLLEGLVVGVHTLAAGTGFTLTGAVRQRPAFGKFKIHCTGA